MHDLVGRMQPARLQRRLQAGHKAMGVTDEADPHTAPQKRTYVRQRA